MVEMLSGFLKYLHAELDNVLLLKLLIFAVKKFLWK